MSVQANVYTSVSSQVWYTDKAEIVTTGTACTYNVALAPGFTNTIFTNTANGPTIPTQSIVQVYVGVGNKLTVSGSDYKVQEVGTASSGTAGVQ